MSFGCLHKVSYLYSENIIINSLIVIVIVHTFQSRIQQNHVVFYAFCAEILVPAILQHTCWGIVFHPCFYLLFRIVSHIGKEFGSAVFINLYCEVSIVRSMVSVRAIAVVSHLENTTLLFNRGNFHTYYTAKAIGA